MRRADRLIRIVHFLRGRRQAATARQIADEFEICTRTVYRDIQDLQTNGAPITGEAGVGYVIDKSYYLPPVSFDAEELEAIGLGISMAAQWTDSVFAAKAQSALEKVRAVLPTDLQGELDQITIYSGAGEGALPWTISFSDLRCAIRERRMIHIVYVDTAGQSTERDVRPLALIAFSPVWLLAGWCETRGDFRHFRLDRIRSMAVGDRVVGDWSGKDFAAYQESHDSC